MFNMLDLVCVSNPWSFTAQFCSSSRCKRAHVAQCRPRCRQTVMYFRSLQFIISLVLCYSKTVTIANKTDEEKHIHPSSVDGKCAWHLTRNRVTCVTNAGMQWRNIFPSPICSFRRVNGYIQTAVTL